MNSLMDGLFTNYSGTQVPNFVSQNSSSDLLMFANLTWGSKDVPLTNLSYFNNYS